MDDNTKRGLQGVLIIGGLLIAICGSVVSCNRLETVPADPRTPFASNGLPWDAIIAVAIGCLIFFIGSMLFSRRP